MQRDWDRRDAMIVLFRYASAFLWQRSSILLALLLLGVQLYSGCASIIGNIPYVTHVDEPQIMERAANILRTGNLNPKFYNYPSLSIYFAATAMAVGYFHDAAKLPP